MIEYTCNESLRTDTMHRNTVGKVRYAFILLLLVLSTSLLAQGRFPSIEKIQIKDRLLYGWIGDYPITIYLKFNQYANYHLGAYSVEGWYYYDKFKTKIPLVGLYGYKNKLTLYSFQDASRNMELLHFLSMKGNHWKDMEYYENLTGYREKFVFNDSTSSWTDSNKKLKVQLEDDDFEIAKYYEFLKLDSNKVFDLRRLKGKFGGYTVVAEKNNRLILQYEDGSTTHTMGRCGAGVEKGFVELVFNEEGRLMNYQKYISESCWYGIEIEKEREISDHIKAYDCQDYLNDKSYTLILDLEHIAIEKKESTGP